MQAVGTGTYDLDKSTGGITSYVNGLMSKLSGYDTNGIIKKGIIIGLILAVFKMIKD